MTKKKNTIVFQGEPGANSHIACREAYPNYEARPCATFEDCFAAVSAGEAELAIAFDTSRGPVGYSGRTPAGFTLRD